MKHILKDLVEGRKKERERERERERGGGEVDGWMDGSRQEDWGRERERE